MSAGARVFSGRSGREVIHVRYRLRNHPFIAVHASVIGGLLWSALVTGLPANAETEPGAAGGTGFSTDTGTITGEGVGASLFPDSVQPDCKTIVPAGLFYGSFTSDHGPFLIDGSVTVPSGKTLELGPGAVVYVGGDGNSAITVLGRIIARGAKRDPVIFMSAKRRPNPWDWNGITCLGADTSVFEHCILRHSKRGISAENGVLNIKECVFERNYLYAVTIKNSRVALSRTIVRGGQMMALRLGGGAVVRGEDVVVTDNTTGIGCDGSVTLALTRGSVSGNGTGLVVSPDASVSITGTEISRNKIGVIAPRSVPKKNRKAVFANGVNQKKINAAGLRAFFGEPETALPRTPSKSAVPPAKKQETVPEFSSFDEPEEGASSFIGSVNAGFRYFVPSSRRHPLYDTVLKQTLYPAGPQPEIQVFANGKRGKTDVNLLVDMYANRWLSTEGYLGKNTLNCGLLYDNHTLSFGDFTESASEISINGRQLTGIRYTGHYWDMDDGAYRMEYTLAAGETEVPRDSGRHDCNQYNVTVDSGMSTRQQITYIMAATLRPTRTTTFSAEGIIARDQSEEPLLRKALADPGAPHPIEAQTGRLAGTVTLINGAMELFAEVDLGSHDTIDSAGARDVAWYDPELGDALPKIACNFFSRADFLDHFAAVAGGRGTFGEYGAGASFTEIAPHYFSAGNPYLEVHRRIGRCNAEKRWGERATLASSYEYERAMSSGSLIDRNGAALRYDYSLGENKPAFSLDYGARLETYGSSERCSIVANGGGDDSTASVSYESRKLMNTITLEERYSAGSAVSHGCSYRMLWDNDLSRHADVRNNDIGDRMQHQVSGWLSFKLKTIFRSKTSFRVTMKDENRDSLRSLAYKVSEQVGLTLIPRKLNLTFAADAAKKNEKEYASDTFNLSVPGWQNPVITSYYGGDIEAKYSFTARLSVIVKGRYERSADDIQNSRENYDALIAGLHVTYLF